jgi:integrase
MSDQEKFDSFTDYLMYLKKESKVSSSSVNNTYNALKKFYKANNIKLDWDYISQYKGKDEGRIVEDRVYTKDEILQMLDYGDLRNKVIILTLLSTGMRVGGLAGLRIKDLEYIDKYGGLYKFTVYSDDNNEKYTTFCTPECADTIDKYIEYRKRNGDNITPESAFIHKKTVRVNGKNPMKEINCFDVPMSSLMIQQTMSHLQRRSHVMDKEKANTPEERGRIRKSVMRCHSFRKIFDTTCIEQNVNHYVKEKLLGHKAKLGLDIHYFRPTENQLLNEYLKVIDALTVNDEKRLKRENTLLRNEKEILEHEKESVDLKIKELIIELNKRGMNINLE